MNRLALHLIASTLVFTVWGQAPKQQKQNAKPVDSARPVSAAEVGGASDTQVSPEDLVA